MPQSQAIPHRLPYLWELWRGGDHQGQGQGQRQEEFIVVLWLTHVQAFSCRTSTTKGDQHGPPRDKESLALVSNIAWAGG